jgi:hypothetical protein
MRPVLRHGTSLRDVYSSGIQTNYESYLVSVEEVSVSQASVGSWPASGPREASGLASELRTTSLELRLSLPATWAGSLMA